MKIAYYAANLQGLTWVKPVHDLTGGALCTDREATASQARTAFPDSRVLFFEAGAKWSARRTRGESLGTLSRREDHISLARIAREEHPDIVVTTANFPHYIRRSGWGALRQGGAFPDVKQAQIFHGISSKHNKFRPFMANYDLLLLVGQRDKERFERIGVLRKTRWRLIGLPRFDRVARGEINRDATLNSLGLDPARPTLLYAPTHGALSSFFEWGLDICRAVPTDCNLIIKPHPLIARALNAGSAGGITDEGDSMWRSMIEYSTARDGTVFLPEHADIQTLMVGADVLVTDFSSAAEEFLLFNKPLVFANHLTRSGYHRTRGEWDEIHACGEVVTEARDFSRSLARAIEYSMGASDPFEPVRTRMRDYVFHAADGHAAKRAAEAMTELVAG